MSIDHPYFMIHNIEKQVNELKKKKYNIILKFMNDLFSQKYKSLKDYKEFTFSKIKPSLLKKNISSYSNDFSSNFKISEENIEDYDIVELLDILLGKIEYSIQKKMKDDNVYYYINDKPSKKKSE